MVVTPLTIAQPRSDPEDAADGAESRGPAPWAALKAHIIIDTKVTKDIACIVMNSRLNLSGGSQSIGMVIKLYTTHQTNCVVVMLALSGKVFFML